MDGQTSLLQHVKPIDPQSVLSITRGITDESIGNKWQPEEKTEHRYCLVFLNIRGLFMKYVALGRTDLTVSECGFGCIPIIRLLANMQRFL